MVEIDGQFFEPLFYGSFVEYQMILSNDIRKLGLEIDKAFGISNLYDKINLFISNIIKR